jgi:hypothetical protein
MKRRTSAVLTQNDVETIWRPDVGGQALRIRVACDADTVLFRFKRQPLYNKPTMHTVQVAESSHISLDPPFLAMINHSCDPSVWFDVETFSVVSLKKLQPGNEITYFYPSTEWFMTAPFRCECGAKGCLHMIRGASELSADLLDRYPLAPHIRAALSRRDEGRGLVRQANPAAAIS